MNPFDRGEPTDDYVQNPYEALRELRDRCPYHLADRQTWAVSTYDRVRALFADDRLELTNASSFADRSPAFRNTIVRALRNYFASIEGHSASAVAARVVADRARHVAAAERVELVSEVARSIPLAIMGELLGVPAAERRHLGTCADATIASYDLRWPGRVEGGRQALQRLHAYFAVHLDRLRRQGGGTDLTRLLFDTSAGDAALMSTLPDVFAKLLSAGTTTTSALLGNLFVHALERPDDLTGVPPDRLNSLVDELIRLHTPVLASKRRVRTTLEVGGERLPEGADVLLFGAAANRDARVWPSPDRILPATESRRHLTFGHGRHVCLGAPLARLEVRLVLTSIVPLLRRFTLAAPVTWRRAWLLREPAAIDVSQERLAPS